MNKSHIDLKAKRGLSGKCLLCKHEDLSSDLQNTHKGGLSIARWMVETRIPGSSQASCPVV